MNAARACGAALILRFGLVVVSALLPLTGCGRVQGLAHTESPLVVTPATLDFGVVNEGTAASLKLHVENAGRASVPVTVSLTSSSSGDFTFGPVPVRVEAGAGFDLAVTFTPSGAGADDGLAEVSTGEANVAPLQVALRGGPIQGALSFSPDPLDFKPVTTDITSKIVQLTNSGTAGVTISGASLSTSANQDFSLVPPSLPTRLLPGKSLPVSLEYSQGVSAAEGELRVLADDVDGGLHLLRLLPGPLPPCTAGATRACYTGPAATRGVGRCHDGVDTCPAGTWANACTGEVLPAAKELCRNGLDDDCDKQLDNGCPPGDACGWTPTTAPDAWEPNNTEAAAHLETSVANSTHTYTYELTLPPGDDDWFQFNIPGSGNTTSARAEILCLNYGGAGCGTSKATVGLTLHYRDNWTFQTDGQNSGLTGLAVVSNSGSVSSLFGPQRWLIHVVPSSTVCTGEALNATLKVTITNT